MRSGPLEPRPLGMQDPPGSARDRRRQRQERYSFRIPLNGPRALVLHGVCFVLGLPGSLGLVLGMAPCDWPVPLRPQSYGDFALRTVVYLSGFLLFFGVIGIARGPARGVARALLGDPSSEASGPEAAREESSVRPQDSRIQEGPVPIAEPLYGFLPGAEQNRLARETGYQPLLYTKISILLSGGIGVLLAGAWDPTSDLSPIPPASVWRILAGLYLIAESVHRYMFFARGGPTGTLIGWVLYSALPFRWRRR